MTQDEALHLFEYCDGHLYWRVKPCRRDPIGMKAGYTNVKGYTTLCYKRKRYYAHRIVYLMHYGVLPFEVDHIDGNKVNNRIENLRACTHSQNGYNRTAQTNNKSGVKNVSWSPIRKKWIVFAKIKGKNTNFGGYEDFELAELVATEMRNKYHGAFANHGA